MNVMIFEQKEEPLEDLLTFLPVADEALILMTGVIVPLAGHQVVVSHCYTVFLLKTQESLMLFNYKYLFQSHWVGFGLFCSIYYK